MWSKRLQTEASRTKELNQIEESEDSRVKSLVFVNSVTLGFLEENKPLRQQKSWNHCP